MAATLAFSAGCVGHRAALQAALGADTPALLQARDREARYLVRYPDILEVQVAARPDCSGLRAVDVDGGVRLAEGIEVSAAGRSAPAIARLAARGLGLAQGAVVVRVARYESQQVFLVGGGGAIQQALPYRGPETVAELLHRAGGLGAVDLDDIRVVRAHVADGTPPEVFPVDLAAILLKKETRSNVRLEPFDRVYVSQSRRARLEARLPPWLKRVSSP